MVGRPQQQIPQPLTPPSPRKNGERECTTRASITSTTAHGVSLPLPARSQRACAMERCGERWGEGPSDFSIIMPNCELWIASSLCSSQ
jgi:hypothetical protein